MVAGVPTWAREEQLEDWQVVDRALRSIAQRRAVLDAEESRWLREAEMLQIWKPLGMVNALDYMERVLGYAPRTALDRLRVARTLGCLPALEGALGRGELSFSAVRELTRVATPPTEAEWIAAAAGKNLRQLEELVANHQPGDRPSDPETPNLRPRLVRMELPPAVYAKWRQAHQALSDEHGMRLDDVAFASALADRVLDGHAGADPDGRARHQIALTVCSNCRQGWQEGAGAAIAVDAATVECAECDAQHIGSIDGAAPERATQTIPPAIVRFVWRRDGGRCQVPGCRSAHGLQIHHLRHREHGGDHDPRNLILVCGAHHVGHHEGRLLMSGTADKLVVEHPNQPKPVRAHVGTQVEAALAQHREWETVVNRVWDEIRRDAPPIHGLG
jgi:hypothetical protein